MTFCALLNAFFSLLLLPALLFGGEDQLEKMSLDEKIAQLFVLPAAPFLGEAHLAQLEAIIQKHSIGGFLCKQGTGAEHKAFAIRLNALSKIPPLLMRDAEWGAAQQLTDGKRFQSHNALGQLENKEEITVFGECIGLELKELHVSLNLAPVVDLGSEGSFLIQRVFSSDPYAVALCAKNYLLGLKKAGVYGCLKHFPGHGFATGDSHLTLPRLETNLEISLQPFRELIKEKGLIDFVMVAHLIVPAIDPDYPSTLSKKTVTELLKKEMGFSGLVITDALNMEALAKNYTPEEVGLLAYSAGNHFLLYGNHLEEGVRDILDNLFPRAFARLKKGFESGELSVAELDARVLQILSQKAKMAR